MRTICAGTLVSIGSIAGCSVAGSWRAVETSPQGAPFPINEVTFAEGGKYTATGLFTAQGQHDGKVHTTTGEYKMSGQKLRLSPAGGPTLEYKTRRRADGKLVMTFRPPGQQREVTAVLAPTSAPAPVAPASSSKPPEPLPSRRTKRP